MVKVCPFDSPIVHMEIELLNCCERLSCFLRNRKELDLWGGENSYKVSASSLKSWNEFLLINSHRTVAYSVITGCALNTLLWASSLSILILSSISFRISSSCLATLSNLNGSGFVHCLDSGFGGNWILKWNNLSQTCPRLKLTTERRNFGCIPQDSLLCRDMGLLWVFWPFQRLSAYVWLVSQTSFLFQHLVPGFNHILNIFQKNSLL